MRWFEAIRFSAWNKKNDAQNEGDVNFLSGFLVCANTGMSKVIEK